MQVQNYAQEGTAQIACPKCHCALALQGPPAALTSPEDVGTGTKAIAIPRASVVTVIRFGDSHVRTQLRSLLRLKPPKCWAERCEPLSLSESLSESLGL